MINDAVKEIVSKIVEESLSREGTSVISDIYSVSMDVSNEIMNVFAEISRQEREAV